MRLHPPSNVCQSPPAACTTQGDRLQIRLWPGRGDDAEACGRIVVEARKSLCDQHHFPLESPAGAAAPGLGDGVLTHPGCYAGVAELAGQTVGSTLLDARAMIAGIGRLIRYETSALMRG